ncbi:IS91 family transposase [soil metagenome]
MLTLGAIASRHGDAYLARHGAAILPSHRRALHDLAACRTAALGGHVSGCDHCGYEHFTYHSCRNRSCPQCHTAATTAWSAARETELLPIPYFHVVFTIPSELRAIVRTHQRVALALLMATAADSLQALAADAHYVGGRLGILAVLHTWTRALVYHPHVHCLVPGGGLAPDGQTWAAARADFLVPVRALSVHFRARFLARLRAQLPEVVLPPRLWQTPWVVYCKPAVQGSGAVLHYLARYVHRVAITNARLVSVTHEQVTFRYRDRRDAGAGAWRAMTLSADAFLRRFLQHVLPRGFHKVRYYGIWHPSAASLRARLTLALTSPPPATARPRPERVPASGGPLPPRPCPRCDHGMLHFARVIARAPRPRPTAMAP